MKNKKRTIIIVALLCATVALFAFTTDSTEHALVNGLIVNTLDKAQAEGYISARDRREMDEVLATGIVDEVLDAWIESGHDISIAVDKAAEVSVREGWYKNKQSAKRSFRQTIEQTRKNGALFSQLYQVMGL